MIVPTLRRRVALTLLAIAAITLAAGARSAFAQTPPAYFSVYPGYIEQGECYVIDVGVAYITLDLDYGFSGGGGGIIYGWPQTGAYGYASVCTSTSTAPGNYYFYQARNTYGGPWVGGGGTVTVAPPPQPDYGLWMSPIQQSVTQPGIAYYTVGIDAYNGFYDWVEVWLDTSPGGGYTSPTWILPGQTTTLAAYSAGAPTNVWMNVLAGSYSASVGYRYRSGQIYINPPPPPNFTTTISPGSQTVAQNGSTTFSVSVSPSNGFSSPVSLSVSGLPAGVSASFTPATLSYPYSSAATLTLTPSGATPIATSGFTVTGSGGGLNRSAGASLTVTNLQPTSLTFNVPQGYAGSDSYTVTVGAGQNMLLDIRYTLNGNTVPDQSIQLDASGQYFHALTHSDAPGLYDFTHFKNAQNAEWIAFPAGGHPQYTVYPPQPQNLTVTPSSFDLPGTYAMTAANGADVAMDFIYSFQPQGGTEGPDITHVPLGWPVLAPISPGSPDGTADIIATECTPPGVYRYKKIRNTLNSAWVDLPGPVTATVTSALVLDSTSNVGAQAGTSVSVTLQGEFLCDLDLSTTYPGLTIADPAYGTPPQDPEGTLATALFTVAPGTGPGIAEITVTGPAGEATFNFGIGTGSAPTVTAISPNARPAGSNATVTIFGTSLIGAELETTTPGVSFSDYDWAPSGTSMTATFMIDITAQQGTVPINVTTTAGTVATSLFSIGDPQPALTREYIYLGGRVIAVESQ